MKRLSTTQQRRNRARQGINGTADKPRLSINISNRSIYAQLIDDTKSNTIIGMRSNGKGSIAEQAKILGVDFAKAAKNKKVSKIAFDRRGKMYANRLEAFATAARESGLEF